MSDLAAKVAADTFLRSFMDNAFALRPPARKQPQHLYAIQSATGEVKIGRAADPRGRLKQLQSGNPHALRLALVVEGAGGYEREIHSRLHAIRLHGEWFEPPALPIVRRMFGAEL